MTMHYNVADVAEYPGRGLWSVTLEDEKGERRNHIFPKSTLEWRAAEYDIDDPGELLDIILHEGFDSSEEAVLPVSLSSPPRAPAADRQARVTLYTSQSTTEAREAHRARIAAIKDDHRIVPPAAGPDPLDVIRAQHGIAPQGLREKRERVDTHRWVKQHGALPIPPETPGTNAAADHASLA